MREVLVGITTFALIVVAVILFLFVVMMPMAWLESKGCDRKEEVQGVETSFHFTTGCIYVDPDYRISND